MGIPVVIGVTGHRDIRIEDIPKLREKVSCELRKIVEICPNSEIKMLNSIASGADTLCAEEALKLGISIICPLPMDKDEYRKDFEDSETDLKTFNNLLEKAESVFTTPAIEPLPDTDDPNLIRHFGYRQAGLYIANHCHVLLALWNGAEPEKNGCGTAETVDFMINGNRYAGNSLKSPDEGAVIWIHTPRIKSPEGFETVSEIMEVKSGNLKKILTRTDEFNRESKEYTGKLSGKHALLSAEDMERIGERGKNIHETSRVSAKIARKYQDKYLNTIKRFSVFGILLVICFLLYDEVEAKIFLELFGVVIIIYYLSFLGMRSVGAHMKYLEHRMLSEASRVQFYLSAAGSTKNAANAFTWTQKEDISWIISAMGALTACPIENKTIADDTLKKSWIMNQLDYHKNAAERDGNKKTVNEKMARAILIAAVAFYAVSLILAVLFPDIMDICLFDAGEVPFLAPFTEVYFSLNVLLKIILGVLSGITAFLSNYFGKLSLERKETDHIRMEQLFMAASERYDRSEGSHMELFEELAREEIIENGNWFSYCRENSPTFDI